MDGSEQHDRNALMGVCVTLESVREALDEGDVGAAREGLAKRIGILAGRMQVWPYDPIPSRTAVRYAIEQAAEGMREAMAALKDGGALAAQQAMDNVAATVLQACSMDWWQGLSDADQRRWLQHADSEQPRNAYVCYLNHEHDRLTRTLGRIEAVGKELNRLADA